MAIPLSKHFRMPSIGTYDGTNDPLEHPKNLKGGWICMLTTM